MSDNKSIMVQWGNHMSDKISSSLIKKIEEIVDFDKVYKVCHSYKFADEKTYNAAVKRYRDMRSKILRFCRRQQNNAK